jgi:[ribosomal protein S18]-alanine N-acetyltransferase
MINLDGLPYIVLPMRLEDVPAVSELEHIVFTLPWSSATFGYELRNNPSSEYLTLRYRPWGEESGRKHLLSRSVWRLFKKSSDEDDPALLGYGGFWMMLEEAHICTLAMRPEWRGRGLGELLLAALIAHAYERHAEVVTLEVRVGNITAQNLYTKYGFKTVGRRKAYYSDNHEDAFIMTTDMIVAPAYQERFQQLTEALRARLLAQPNTPPEARPTRP